MKFELEKNKTIIKDFTEFLDESEGCIKSSEINSKFIRSPNSNSFVDLNNDCKADIFIESIDSNNKVFYEFFIKNNNKDNLGKYCLI